MINRTLSIACAVAGLTGLVSAQTINLASCNFASNSGNLDNTSLPASGPANTVVLTPNTTAFVLGDTVNVASASFSTTDTFTWQNEPGFRIENSAFPGQSAYFQLVDAGGTYTSVSLPANTVRTLGDEGIYTWNTGVRTLMAGTNIPNGSTWTTEAFEMYDDVINDVDSVGSGISFTIMSQLTYYAADVLANAGPLNARGWYLTATNDTFTATAASNITLGNKLTFSGDFAPAIPASWGDDIFVVLENSAYPGVWSAIQPYPGVQGVPASVSAVDYTPTGGLLFASIAAGSIYEVEVSDEFNDDGVQTEIEGILSNVSLQLYSTSPIGPANQNLTGTLALGDTVGTFAFNRNISYEVKQGATTLASGTITASTSSSALNISVPAANTGAAQLILDGSSFLRRVVAINLTGSNQAIGTATMQNGDVSSTPGEVDAVDIDDVIANFGFLGDAITDVDVNGEVDAVDIDIVIANFGGLDD